MRIAERLARHNLRATFFQCGTNVLRHREIARELAGAGHEIGNHTFSHRRLCPRIGWKPNLLSTKVIVQEFADAQAAIFDATGVVARVMRPPYGLRWRGVGAAQRELALTTVMWTVIGHDWEWNSPRVVNHVLARTNPGGIICLHDGRDTRPQPDISQTLTAVCELLPRLMDLGFQFETVSEILLA